MTEVKQSIKTARIADWHRLMHKHGWRLTEDRSYTKDGFVLTPDMVARREAVVAETGNKYVPSTDI